MDKVPEICSFCGAGVSHIFSDKKTITFECNSFWIKGKIEQSSLCRIKCLEAENKKLKAEVERLNGAYCFLTEGDGNPAICNGCYGVYDLDEMHYIEDDDQFICDECWESSE